MVKYPHLVGARPMAGQLTLDQSIGVRILCPQSKSLHAACGCARGDSLKEPSVMAMARHVHLPSGRLNSRLHVRNPAGGQKAVAFKPTSRVGSDPKKMKPLWYNYKH